MQQVAEIISLDNRLLQAQAKPAALDRPLYFPLIRIEALSEEKYIDEAFVPTIMLFGGGGPFVCCPECNRANWAREPCQRNDTNQRGRSFNV